MQEIFRDFRGASLTGKILPKKAFVPFSDFGNFSSASIKEKYREPIIKSAEKYLETEYKTLPASVYMQFSRVGNRSIYEGFYFERRKIVMGLALAEWLEGQGRFLDKLIDGIWLLLEESSWVIPAHNPQTPSGKREPLPHNWGSLPDYIDLFAAETGSLLAWVYYISKEILDRETPLIRERALYELDRRIIRPFLENDDHWWMGYKGNVLNNWTPWIISNVLAACAFCVEDDEKRVKITDRSMEILDNFTSFYHSDGGCDEGPSYWGVAGASYFDCAELLYDISEGYIDIFSNKLLRSMGEYIAKVNISESSFLNFADCPAKVNPDYYMIARFGRRCGSEFLYNFGVSAVKKRNGSPSVGFYNTVYREIKDLCEPDYPDVSYTAPIKVWFDGICVMAVRQFSDTSRGLYLAAKGGHNAESHNHNDVGSFIIFRDGKPVFIDVGVGTYTADTFNSNRWKIWTMQSAYHNIPTVNGKLQPPGGNYKAEDVVYDQSDGSLSLSLINAYPADSGLKLYKRKYRLDAAAGEALITDEIELEETGEVEFNLMTPDKPDLSEAGIIKLKDGGTAYYDKTLTAECDGIELTDKRISSAWGRDKLYRIRLKTPESFKSGIFTLGVK